MGNKNEYMNISIEGYLSKKVFRNCDFQEVRRKACVLLVDTPLLSGYRGTFRACLFGFKDKVAEKLLLFDGRFFEADKNWHRKKRGSKKRIKRKGRDKENSVSGFPDNRIRGRCRVRLLYIVKKTPLIVR